MTKMRSTGDGLEFAYPLSEVDQLLRKVGRFFQNQQVQKAEGDTRYRLSTRFTDAECPSKYYPKTKPPDEGIPRTLSRAAASLQAAVNNTEKRLARAGGYTGLNELSVAHQRLGFIVDNERFEHTHLTHSAVELGEPIEDTQHRIRLHCVLCVELQEHRMEGVAPVREDDDEYTTELKKIAHGLHLGFERIGTERVDARRFQRGYSHGATAQELEYIWSFGNAAPRKITSRILGMDLRYRIFHELTEAEREAALQVEYPDLEWHTLVTEVCGEGNIRGGKRPLFFQHGRNKGCAVYGGPEHPDGKTVDFELHEEKPLDEQVPEMVDSIAAMLFHPNQG